MDDNIKKRFPIDAVDMSDYSRIPKNITDVMLTSKQNGLSINSIRIILILLARVKNDQLFKPEQLSLFDDTFTDINVNVTTGHSVQFNFYWKDLLPRNSRNYSKAEEGLKELLDYKGEHVFVNEKKERIRMYSSIISDIIINENQKGVKFNMNIAWYRIFLQITTYNKYPNEIIFEVSSLNAFIWYFFLKTLPINQDGYTFTLEQLNEKFNTDYRHLSRVKDKILDPVKLVLDKRADISFNYKIDGNKLRVVTYYNSSSVPVVFANDDDLKTARTLKYQKKKSNLSADDISILESIYKRYGYDTLYTATARQKSLNGLNGREYVNEVHRLVMLTQTN